MIVSDVNEDSLKEMDLLVGEGVTSFKLFMAYPGVFYSDDGQILRAMQRAADNGGLIMMHAENGIAIDVLVEQALAGGETDPRYHGEVRHGAAGGRGHPPRHRARPGGGRARSTSCTSRPTEAVAEIAQARDEGCTSSARPARSTCSCPPTTSPSPDFEGAKYVCSTPLRPKEHQAALWRGLRTNDLQVVSTDHCPFCFKGQKELGRGDFSKIPNGLPGVENRMDLLHQAVVDGHISRRRWIEIACATPARMFGLYPRKGTIAPGADADIVIYDPHAEQTSLGRDPPHERRLLGVRGQADHRPGRDRALARRASSSTAASTPARPATAVPRPAPPAGTSTSRKEPPWTSDSSCRPIRPARRSST